MLACFFGSLGPDVRGLDDRPPLLDLGFLVCLQRLGSLLPAWWIFETPLPQSLPHGRIGHGFGRRQERFVSHPP
jgi:hypothetical protein